jgi:hypothetical protein
VSLRGQGEEREDGDAECNMQRAKGRGKLQRGRAPELILLENTSVGLERENVSCIARWTIDQRKRSS